MEQPRSSTQLPEPTASSLNHPEAMNEAQSSTIPSESEEEPTPRPLPTTPSQKILVDFSWRKFTTLFTDASTSTPLFKVKYHMNKPQLEFRSLNGSEETTLGIGTLNQVSINTEASIRGRHIKIKPLSHFKSRYTYLSQTFAESSESPMVMEWTGGWGLKTLDITCLNDRQEAVARLSCNVWAIKKIATLELTEAVSGNQERLEEIAVTGLTLAYCLSVRAGSLPSFLGALFSKPGPIKQPGAEGQNATPQGVIR